MSQPLAAERGALSAGAATTVTAASAVARTIFERLMHRSVSPVAGEFKWREDWNEMKSAGSAVTLRELTPDGLRGLGVGVAGSRAWAGARPARGGPAWRGWGSLRRVAGAG
jgi:hypothetical protein